MELNPTPVPLFEKSTAAFRQPLPMPASIAIAVLKVQVQIVSLAKSNVNRFASFNYTSVDQIYELVGVKMAEAGLIILPTELAPSELVYLAGKSGEERWGKFEIGFIYVSDKGDTWTDPSLRETLWLRIESGLSFHAAKSLAQKTHLRSVFKIPTGEEEPEAEAGKDDVKPASVVEPKATKLSVAESKKLRDEMLADLKKLATPPTAQEQETYTSKYAQLLDTMLTGDANFVRAEFQKRARG